MARIPPLTENDLQPSVQEYQGRITNMKATLGHSLLAFEVYMQG